PYYLDAIRLGQRDAKGEDVAIASGDEVLTLTYKLGGGTVRGTCESRVIIVPEEAAYRRMGFVRVAECDARGRFQIAAVRPGEYAVFAAKGPPFASLAGLI